MGEGEEGREVHEGRVGGLGGFGSGNQVHILTMIRTTKAAAVLRNEWQSFDGQWGRKLSDGGSLLDSLLPGHFTTFLGRSNCL